ncbi:PilN domain-containing protein [Neiella sp. HB171785]|uniref:PilN domain-containing protein n=1 Tax=Neiella litorisoli TaxID=2771431 RepID=A0A8J6UH13_9GAMM|nr:PilN domain-containing protein [Neiella litorisoli]MBD1391081.1 PilN domain-containing protein [Neiella litorisoli]
MKNQIDLFSADLVPRQLRINFRLVAISWAAAAVLLIVASLISGWINGFTEQELVEANRVKNGLNQQHQNLMSAHKARTVSAELTVALEQAQREIRIKQQLLKLVADGERSQAKPYSTLMRDLASINEPRLWLQAIQINGDQLAISGLASDAEAVPAWLSQVGAKSYLSNQTFNQLTIAEQEHLHSFTIRSQPDNQSSPANPRAASAKSATSTKSATNGASLP